MMGGLVLELSCVAGILISLYFLGIWKGLFKAHPALVPKRLCTQKTCSSLLETTYAKFFFDIPNFELGILYYFLVFNTTFFVLPYWLTVTYLVISIMVFLFSAYLFYVLVHKLKTPCALCFTAHFLNMIIMVYFLMQVI